MFETLASDRKTIERKYHNPDEPFNSFDRMNYHGYDYDVATGLDDAQIEEGLTKLEIELEGLPHPIIKAKMFEYVLDHTRIDVNEHDYFIGLYTWGRVISKHTVFKWHDEVYNQFPHAKQIMRDFKNAGAVFGQLDYDHTIPDWDSIMDLGFAGLLRRAEDCYQSLKDSGKITEKKEIFFRGLEIEYKAIIRFIDRVYQYALKKSFSKAPVIAKCLKHLREGAPTDTYEALQLIYIYFMLSESVEHYQVRSLGYGLDGTLYPFFVKDIESGRYTKEEIGAFIGYFLMQWSAIGNYWGQPFYLAGTNLDGSTKVNELSYLILDVYDKLGIYNPKIQIKVNKYTPKEFVCRALEMIRHGSTSIVFCNEEIITKSMMSRGYTYEESVDSTITGCYEWQPKAKEIGISATYISALKPISLVLDNGFDVITGKQIGIKTGSLSELTNFKLFYSAYLKQLEYMVCTFLRAINTMETKVNDVNPSLLFSGTIPACVDTMTDALDCGIENDTGVLLSGLASGVDALMAVKDLVYDRKIINLEELNHALHMNWKGYEKLQHMALTCKHKYGNGDIMADYYAATITRVVSNLLTGRKNSHGGQFILEMHSARAFIMHGEATLATPDGRMMGEETSKNASPAPGADRKGITALINSATQIDPVLCNNGFCLDAMIHPSAVQGEDGMEALYGVLVTYMNKGGASIHFNIFNPELLRDAQQHPEKYQNLQVRVCGWNVLWNNMVKSEQDAYILRAENIQ